MNHQLPHLLAVALLLLGCASVSNAGDAAGNEIRKKTVIALQTDEFELAETDISDLQVGEAETIITDSGKTINLVRTASGIEVYVDGELLDKGLAEEEGLHDGHKVRHKRVEVFCQDAGDCEKTVEVTGGEAGTKMEHEEDGKSRTIVKTIRVECSGEDECADHKVWVSGDEDVELESVHEHGGVHGLIIIHEGEGDAGAAIEEEVEIERGGDGEKVYVIKKKVREN